MAAEQVSDRGYLTASDAETLDVLAMQKRELALQGDGSFWSAQLRAEAEGLEAFATALRDPARPGMPVFYQGHGGEVAPRENLDLPGRLREVAAVVTGSDRMLAADASLARLNLARNGGVLALAVEAAKDAGAATAIEKMMAHQLALAHQLGMSLFTAAQNDLDRHRSAPHLNTNAIVEAGRNANAAARIMDAFARGALALDRLRNGGRQVVTVHHLEVKDGGQAVVTGSVKTGDHSRGSATFAEGVSGK